MDLFEQNYQNQLSQQAPLAARMRPRTLDEFIGQEHIIAPGRLLRRAISADQLSSLIFFGPPGTGKTTLARIIANTTKAHFISINAVLAGVKDIRDAISTATDKRKYYNQKTILFVDEVHRFNKSQQDALLPHVENGTVILIGATTENPYFEVNKALVSRSRIFQLKQLEEKDLKAIVYQALQDCDRGYGKLNIDIHQEALSHLINVANGDARSLLNALELAVETTSKNQNQVIEISLQVAEESIQQRAVLYDKEGDAHFDTISAYIKSIRGSDADAALYWLAKMIYAGENPRFIFRRLLIQASEDIGLADSQAIVIVNSCAQAFDRVGMPEGRYHLAQATLYLANAPKSNSVMGFFDALASVEKEKEKEIPNHLKDANRDSKGFGHGAGYLYPHAYRDHWVEQQYLPQSLQGQVFYQPADVGEEALIKIQVERRREAQLAAMVEETVEVLSYGEKDKVTDNWLQRTLGEVGENFSKLRDNLFEIANPQRHHLILDLNAKSGLLTWEAVRRVPEGGVYSWVRNEKDARALIEQSNVLPELTRPIVIHPSLSEIPDEVKFDRIIGRNALGKEVDKLKNIFDLVKLLNRDGKIILGETIPRRSQRLYNLLDKTWLSDKLFKKIVAAESAIYSNPDDAMVNWNVEDLEKIFIEVGLEVEITQQKNLTQLYITENLLNRWFTASENETRPSYINHLEKELTNQEIETVKSLFYGKLSNRVVEWETAIAIFSVS
ncbi:AAA ATPase [Rivularia sp. PCC 7116]|uniref:AAA family ATPase n=1 Tax=Rivularia sp. PCC 7116 TaxID=373994 RepID=UPI00029F4482|nr:AAA family ATPase [Rivularia sp. PCC 7116]AFY56780.1 AAA ATPase [Rivularia sp. PCC 7116]